MLKYDITEYKMRLGDLAGETLYLSCMRGIYIEAVAYFWRQGDMDNFYCYGKLYQYAGEKHRNINKLLRHAINYGANLPVSFLMVDSNI